MDRRKFTLFCTALCLLLLLPHSLEGATRGDVAPDADQSESSLHYVNKNLAYFNASHHTHITVPSTLSLRDLISFSFRTCSYGSLIQAGSTEDFLHIDLTPEGHLKVSWEDYIDEDVVRRTHTILVGDDTSAPLNSNQWYTIDVRFKFGEIFLTVEQGSRLVHRILMSNGSYHEYLQDLDLVSSDIVKIGMGFTGCFLGGPNILLDQPGLAFGDTPVEIGRCPLEDSLGCDSDGENQCWKYPCSNGGTCERRDDLDLGYTCTCPLPYTGENCEIDQGHLGCSLDPCLHDAECVTVENGTRKYYCECPLGYTGVNCEIDINECMPGPCQNGAQCSDLINAYYCNCSETGFEGDHCEINIDECERDHPCDDGATCTDTPGSYKCQCRFGFGGKHCEDGLNECLSNPCRHGAECVDHLGMYECVCVPGFTGGQCEVDVDDCLGITCNRSNAECSDEVNAYSCQCTVGYSDTEGGECVEIDECAASPCQHGATCKDYVGSYECVCLEGYTGLDCEMDIDDCRGDFCHNGARCEDLVNAYVCQCLPGFAGINCDRDERSVDDCDLDPCHNGATCMAMEPTGYTCHCADDFMGRNCSEIYNACALRPCHHAGNCSTDQPEHYRVCTCPAGYTGPSCETDIDDCVGVTCDAPTECLDQVDGYMCACPVGYEGEACNVTNDCASSPCNNGGSCSPDGDSYRCDCVGAWVNHTVYTGDNTRVYWVGYTGTNCDVDVSECELSPNICLNGGICQSVNGTEYGFRCYCPNGEGDYFTGIYCQDKLPYCAIINARDPPVCDNGGQCEDVGDDSYKCHCEPGFTGYRCETNIDECNPNPCENNATCVDGYNEYACACLEGYSGVNCSIDTYECESNPCQHGGQCLDRINGYICNCTGTGFNGTLCEYEINECLYMPCKHDGACNNLGQGSIMGYSCSCHPGYSGYNCEVDMDECLSEPCQYNGTCVENSDESLPGFEPRYAAGYKCECLTGFTGSNCEENINDCEHGDACVYGECVDAINEYVCACLGGYRGKHCDIQVDECAVFTPCQYGAACRDKINGYDCICSRYMGMDYGGKNCSVPLSGCADNMCQNDAPCVPVLVTEEPPVHSYMCDCPPGLSGKYCGQNTTASFFGSSWLRYGGTDGDSEMDLLVQFQTTLRDALLMVNIKTSGETPEHKYVLLQLLGGDTLTLSYVNTESTNLEVTPGVSFADGSWYTVNVTIRDTGIALQLFHKNCPDSKCSDEAQFPEAGAGIQHHTLGDTWFGGDELQLDFTKDMPMFTGCMQDIKIDSITIIPEDYIGNSSKSSNVAAGCARAEQCGVQACNSHGNCTDLWFEYNCSCWRPYIGENCDEDYTAGTFGHEEKTSRAEFTLPDDPALKEKNDISYFFRTRQENGLMFYLGSRDATTYLVTDVSAGHLRVRLKLGLGEQICDQFTDYIANGIQYYFRVIRESTHVRFWVQPTGDGDPTVVDENEANQCAVVNFDAYMNPEVFYVGGFPPSAPANRRRRDILTDSLDFEGTIQDIRQNGWLAQLFPLNNTNTTGEPPSYPAPELVDVLAGEQTDDMCTMYTPCINNATCTNEFFNDYVCTCTEGFRGKNCSELDFCVSNQCPGNATCLNLEDGYECVDEATFNGITSYLQYSNSLNVSIDINTIFIRFRTRKTGVTLLHVKGTGVYVNNYITMEVIHEVMSLTFDLGESSSLESTVNITDGDWHNSTLIIESGGVILKVDDIHQAAQNNLTNDVTLFDLVQSSTDVFVAGVPPAYLDTHSGMIQANTNFKGCLEEVRIGNILLPFFNQSELENNTSEEQFCVTTIQDVEIDCTGDPVCDTDVCDNNSTCDDIWNAYKCDCLPGFEGRYCGIDINECIGHACKNNATCVDDIANYTCTCMDGYTGDRCEIDIDECDSSPCWNNGTCINLINQYECNCTANFTGDNCQIDINENCDYNPDLCNNGTCITVNTTVEGVTTFNCSCEPGITGRYCESEIDYCEGNPCSFNATCQSQREFLNYTCICADGYTGRDCETEIDECSPNPCQNGANCTDYIARYECQCSGGWEGVDCSIDINECNSTENNSSQLCNYGECVNLDGSYECNCTGSGYEGEDCSEDINECLDENLCKNDATCENFDGGYDCNCTFGYNGDNCEIANCSLGNCNNGTCQIEEGKWSCDCPPFVEGFRCESPGPCVEEPCENNATCSQTGDVYQCACVKGWEGTDCDQDINECDTFGPCQNNATCQNLDGSYNCVCVPGFTDFNCSTDIDECEGAPCMHNGQCIDQINAYMCDCSGTGYKDDNCSTDINECSDEAPCQNGGTCLNLPGSFNCTCLKDYVGVTCHSTNPCVIGYCQNGGTCDYVIDDGAENATAVCVCEEPYDGPQCEFTNGVRKTASKDNTLPIILGALFGAVVLVVLIVLIVMLVVCKEKRATRGTYSPSRQETVGSRVELGNVLKQPPMERLI